MTAQRGVPAYQELMDTQFAAWVEDLGLSEVFDEVVDEVRAITEAWAGADRAVARMHVRQMERISDELTEGKLRELTAGLEHLTAVLGIVKERGR